MPDLLKVALIGAGGIGAVHAASLAKTPRAKLVAVCDANAAKAAMLAQEHGVKSVFTACEELLALPDLDAVVICTPTFLHASMAIAALSAGKHVLCEKPMATRAMDAAAMAGAAARSGRVFMMAYTRRFGGASMLLKRYIDEGALGRVYAAKAGWVRRAGIPGWGEWFYRKAQSGGGPLIDIGVHMLDLTLWLMGFPEVKAVSGATFAEFGAKGRGFWGGSPRPEAPCDVEDLALAMLRLADGGVVTLEASWASFIAKDEAFLSLLGTGGGANLEPLRLHTEQCGGRVEMFPEVPEIDSYLAEMEHFVDCALNGKQPLATAEQGRRMIGIIEAVYESAVKGREIELVNM